jgi:hypothetical protein
MFNEYTSAITDCDQKVYVNPNTATVQAVVKGRTPSKIRERERTHRQSIEVIAENRFALKAVAPIGKMFTKR